MKPSKSSAGSVAGMLLITLGLVTMVLRAPAAGAGTDHSAWLCDTTTSVGQPCITTTVRSTTTAVTGPATTGAPATTVAAPTATLAPLTVPAALPRITTGPPAVVVTTAAPVSATTAVPTQVLGLSATAPSATTAVLPATGSSAGVLAVIGALLILVGLILLGAVAVTASRLTVRRR